MNWFSQLLEQLFAFITGGQAAPAAVPGQNLQAGQVVDAFSQAFEQYLGWTPAQALRAAAIATAQSSVETARWTSNVFAVTKSLMNRHRGNGRVGVPNSDGSWTGKVYYATSADPDLRVYSSIQQSAQDFCQWLGEFPAVRAAYASGDAGAVGAALDAMGYSATAGYGTHVANTFYQEYASYA